MDSNRKKNNGGHRKADKPKAVQSLAVANKGITTGHDFANFMSALMSDLISGKVSPGVGNAACNAGGKLLKVVEMQMKYGTTQNGAKVLTLALNTPLVQQQDKVQ